MKLAEMIGSALQGVRDKPTCGAQEKGEGILVGAVQGGRA